MVRRDTWLASEDRVGGSERDAAEAPPRRMGRTGRGGMGAAVGLPLLSLLLFACLIYVVWEAVSLASLFPAFTLPSPLQVAQDAGVEISSAVLLANTLTTLGEALGGFVIAAVIAGICGYAIAHIRPLEILAAPFIAASQGIPSVAIAPIIFLLLGQGVSFKIVVCATVVFFPLLVSTVTGLRGVEREYHEVARVFGASRRQTLLMVELPLAAPALLSGLKIGLTLSIIGAVVGEFISANSGLGFMINTSISTFEVAPRYVALITLAVLSIALFGLVTLIERIALQWRDA